MRNTTQLDFPNAMNELLMANKIITDKKCAALFVNSFKISWIDTPFLGQIIKYSLNFFKRYDKTPSREELVNTMSKLLEMHGDKFDFDLADVEKLLNDVYLSSKNISEDVIMNNIIGYAKIKEFLSITSENVDVIVDRKSNQDCNEIALNCIRRLEKFTKMLDINNGKGTEVTNNDTILTILEKNRNPDSKISTGWDMLDYYTSGGFEKDGKRLILFMGQAGLGKSMFLSNLAVNCMKQNLNVVLFSLEMDEVMYTNRFLSHISKVNVNRLRENEGDVYDNYKAFMEKYPNCKLFIKEFPPRTINVATMESYLDNLVSDGVEIDVIIVDYLNLIRSNVSSDNMFQGGLEVSEQLRAMSYKYSAPVFSAVQANTDGMNNDKIDMQHISESRGIAHTADFIAPLYQMEEDKEKSIINMRIAKSRYGGVGKIISFKIDYESLTVTDITMNRDTEDVQSDDVANIVRNITPLTREINQLSDGDEDIF